MAVFTALTSRAAPNDGVAETTIQDLSRELLFLPVSRAPEPSDLRWPTARHRDLCCPQPCGLLVGNLDDSEAAQLLFGLGVRTIDDQRGAARRIDTEHRRIVVESASEYEDSSGLHLCPQRTNTFGRLGQAIVREVGHPLLVERDEVLRHVSSSCLARPRGIHPYQRTAAIRFDTARCSVERGAVQVQRGHRPRALLLRRIVDGSTIDSGPKRSVSRPREAVSRRRYDAISTRRIHGRPTDR